MTYKGPAAEGAALKIRRGAFSTPCRRVGTPRRKNSTNVFRIDEINSLGAGTHRPFAKVTRTLVKHHFYMPKCCFTWFPQGRAFAADFHPGGLQNTCFTLFKNTRPLKNVVFLVSGALWL